MPNLRLISLASIAGLAACSVHGAVGHIVPTSAHMNLVGKTDSPAACDAFSKAALTAAGYTETTSGNETALGTKGANLAQIACYKGIVVVNVAGATDAETSDGADRIVASLNGKPAPTAATPDASGPSSNNPPTAASITANNVTTSSDVCVASAKKALAAGGYTVADQTGPFVLGTTDSSLGEIYCHVEPAGGTSLAVVSTVGFDQPTEIANGGKVAKAMFPGG